jgi:hypothetical protein
VSSLPVIDPDVRRAIVSAATLADLGAVVRTAARRLAGSEGATFVIRDDDTCFYADEDTIAPLWKGQRFPLDECISGWAMLHGEPAVVADITADERIPQAAYLSTYVRSLVMVPVGAPAAAAIGTYWSASGDHASVVPAQTELAHLVAARLAEIGLADAPWAPNFKI